LARQLDAPPDILQRWPDLAATGSLPEAARFDALLALGKMMRTPRTIGLVLEAIDRVVGGGERRARPPIHFQQELDYADLAREAGLKGMAINHYRWIRGHRHDEPRATEALLRMGVSLEG
jgi:hypothetical protein